jgi:hypothetical protein
MQLEERDISGDPRAPLLPEVDEKFEKHFTTGFQMELVVNVPSK